MSLLSYKWLALNSSEIEFAHGFKLIAKICSK